MFRQQTTGYTCAPAALANAIRAKGWAVSEDYLAEVLGTDRGGTQVYNLISYLHIFNPHSQAIRYLPMFQASLVGFLTLGYTCLFAAEGHIWHAVSVMAGHGVLVHDPAADPAWAFQVMWQNFPAHDDHYHLVAVSLPAAPVHDQDWHLTWSDRLPSWRRPVRRG